MTRTDANAAARRSGAEHLLHSEITASVIAAFFEVYRELRYGLGESLYAAAMEIALTGRGLAVRREAVIDVEFRGQKIGNYRADFVINATVVLELKAGAFFTTWLQGTTAQLSQTIRPDRWPAALFWSRSRIPARREHKVIESLNRRVSDVRGPHVGASASVREIGELRVRR